MQIQIEVIEWDDHNLDHATRRVTASDIEQAIQNMETCRRHRVHLDRLMIEGKTDGGRSVTIVARYDSVRRSVRPITAWEST